jgi:hypothetical protein
VEVLVTKNVEATGIGADPEIALAIFIEREDAIGTKIGKEMRRRDWIVEMV